MVDGQVVWDSVSDYLPTPLEVLRNPWMQWVVLLPRDIGGPEYAGIREVAPQRAEGAGAAHRAHPHGVVPPPGRLGGRVRGRRAPAGRPDHLDAVLRARLRPVHARGPRSWWTAASTRRSGSGPRARSTCAGRAPGRSGAVHGLDALPPEVTSLVVDSRLPRPGQPSSGSYEGDGYITVRHPDTEVVTAALKKLVSTVRVELTDERADDLARLPGGDGVLHPRPGPGRRRPSSAWATSRRTRSRPRPRRPWTTTSTPARWPPRITSSGPCAGWPGTCASTRSSACGSRTWCWPRGSARSWACPG